MKEQDFNTFVNLLEEIKDAAIDILDRYMDIQHEITGEPPNEFLRFHSADADQLHFEGDEYWRYGGHEHYSLDLPTYYLYADWEPEVREKFQKQADEKRQEFEKVQARTIAEEKELLKKLQTKYEGEKP